jgi:hypothetical protein
MNPETLEALKGSIEKWRKIVEEGGEDRGEDNCSLCSLFLLVKDCDGCPINDVTKSATKWRAGCTGSPYDQWRRLQNDHSKSAEWKADSPEKLEAARAELDFLRSLLPKEVES